ncbi:MAG: GNAT family N-acetyltransferase [Bacteroidota bacterium]
MPVRRATVADADTLHDLVCALANYEKLRHKVIATANDLRAKLAPDASPPLHALLAEDDAGQPVGFAIYFAIYSTFRGNWGLYLEDLYVRPEARSRGHGYALLQAVAQDAVSQGAQRLEWQVLDWNQLALDFYERLGAKPMSGWVTMRLTGNALKDLGSEDFRIEDA